MAIDNTGGLRDLDKKTYGLDLPFAANPKPSDGVKQGDMVLGPLFGGGVNTDKDKYNQATVVENDSGKNATETARQNFAPNADKPTTASAPPSKDLPSVLKQVDPQAIGQIMGALFAALALANSAMKTSSPAPRKQIITDALSGALALLVKKLGFGLVITAMNRCLNNNAIENVTPKYKEIVQNAFAKLIQDAILYGPNGIPTSTTPTIVRTTILPNPIVNPTAVPDLSVQQYYTPEKDPYPGYIQWLLPEGTLSSIGTNYVYTVRGKDTPPYSTADEEIYAISEREMALALEPYIKTLTLTVDVLNTILATQDQNVENNGMDRTMGKNSGSNIMNLLSALLGIYGIAMNLTRTVLPLTGLNAGKVEAAFAGFARGMSMMMYMKSITGGSFGLSAGLGALGALGGLSGVGGILGNIGGAIGGTLGSAVSALGGGLSGLGGALNQLNATGIPAVATLAALQGSSSARNLVLASAIVGSTPAIVNSTVNIINEITR